MRALQSLLPFCAVLTALASTGCGEATAPGPLVSGERGITSIATDDQFVYWTTVDGSVKRVSLDGGATQIVAKGQHAPDFLHVDETSLFFATSDGVVAKVLKQGGDVVELAQVAKVIDLTILGENVCFATDKREVVKVPKATGPVYTLATAQDAVAVVSGGSDIVWSSTNGKTGALRAVTAAGGAVRDIVDVPSDKVAVNAGKAYLASIADANITTVGLEGGDATVIVDLTTLRMEDQATLTSLHANDQQVFFTLANGAVGRAPVAGGATPDILVKGPGGKVSLALGASSVYWANPTDGTISTMPIPSLDSL